MTPAALLWDFGDTLVDERWMRRAPLECPTWDSVWMDVMAAQADAWNIGQIGADEIFRELADRSGMTATAVRSHARRCCESIDFNETAWRMASARLLPQALVTVNPDLLTDVVVPAHRLDVVFDVIVTSAAEGTADKSALCNIALQRLAFTGSRSKALLIDNRLDLVEAWKALGGAGYWFVDDDKLRADLPSLGLVAAP
ncbi:hypothetical protein HC251_11510 [Iamia sp. SCSIO 61187]|uniref:hypothetical protein n=1 Tax=Iamia sp. SCSIO 61187 TaxID=2722752 RepID=UPI001C624CFD|nr:hypothetical protein [Iamia sp. SCSIO 61187]QYG92996.1 hypothetical protein HC251_11510 [Iamia sp. SCSIO 61187]